MPQFDASSFSSQIFWLAICFIALYWAMSKIYLPRIQEILKERKNNIEQNLAIAAELQSKIYEINAISKKSREQSSLQYQMALDQAVKEANLRREQALSDLRKKTDLMTERSSQEISNFIENSKQNSGGIISNLVNLLNKKVFDQTGSSSTNKINN